MIIPGYDIIEKLGEGGSASVWKARQINLNRLVSIKLLTEKKLANPDMMARFRLEAESTARLNHPGIVHIHDMGEHDQFAYLVMEFVDGESLDEILIREKHLSPDQVLDVAAQIAEAMDYAWSSAHLVHCDIKPGNILIDTTFRVKIADLGISRILGKASEELDQGLITGTPYYCSPEQVNATSLDARSDIYSLGSTLYHALTAQMPFGDDDIESALQRQGNDQIPDPLDIDRSLPSNLVWLLEKMMMIDPDSRQEDWKELIRDIQNVRKGQPPSRLPEEAGLSTIARSPQRLAPKPKSIHIKKKMVVKPVMISSAGKPAPVTSSPSPHQPHRKRFLRSAIFQLLIIGILTAGVYGLVFYMGLMDSDENAPAKRTEATKNRSTAVKGKVQPSPTAIKPASVVKPLTPPKAAKSKNESPVWPGQSKFTQAVEKVEQSRAEYKRFVTDGNQSRLDAVEELARQGLMILEKMQETAPASADISAHIRAANESIFNAGKSRTQNLSSSLAPTPSSTSASVPEAGKGVEELVGSAPAGNPAAGLPSKPAGPSGQAPEFDSQPLALAAGWNSKQDYSLAAVRDAVGVLQAYGSPAVSLDASSSMRFPGGIPYRMPIQLASERLGLSASGRAALRNPILPQRSLIAYQFKGNFGDGFDVCILAVDLKGQVVAAQLTRTNQSLVPGLPRNLYSDRWSTADLLMGTPPKDGSWKVAHRVRRANGGVVVDTEAVKPHRLEPQFSSRLFLPGPMVNVLLNRNLPHPL
jgi:serine/threonine protein kinase